MEYKVLTEPDELAACIEMQKTIWGLEDDGVTSPITLKALSLGAPPVGLITGAFDDGRLVGFSISIGTMAPGAVYGHMLGVLETYRDENVGTALFGFTKGELVRRGVREMIITYEPLESRNAHLYLNKFHGRCYEYEVDCFHVHSRMHDGMPLDRMLARFPLDVADEPTAAAALEGVDLPEARPGDMPDADTVLVRIPGDLAALKTRDMDQARQFRMDTRAVMAEYINGRGYNAIGLRSEKKPEGRISHYILSREL